MITTVSLAQPKQLCHVDELADDRNSSNAAVGVSWIRAITDELTLPLGQEGGASWRRSISLPLVGQGSSDLGSA